ICRAGLVDVLRGNCVGEAGPAYDLTRGIRARACLPRVTEEGFIDERRFDSGAFQSRSRRNRPQLRGMDVPECPSVAPDGGAGRGNDDDFIGRHYDSLYQSVLAASFWLLASGGWLLAYQDP